MRIPDFFIIGAPKAGTTSVRAHLQSYDTIYMPSPEEPNYFCDDLLACTGSFYSESEYWTHFFSGVQAKHNLVGEKSTWYLYSETAVLRIMELRPEVKIIVLLRNPIELVQAFHQEMVYCRLESVQEFPEAWHLQTARRKGLKLPRNRRINEKLFLYSEVGKLGDQLERVMSLCPHEQLFIRFTDDFADARRFIAEIETFLGLPQTGACSLEKINESKQVRSGLLDKMLHVPAPIESLARQLKATTGLRSFGIGTALRWLRETVNTRMVLPVPLPVELEQELREHFVPQIGKLEQLTGRDLSLWVEPREKT